MMEAVPFLASLAELSAMVYLERDETAVDFPDRLAVSARSAGFSDCQVLDTHEVQLVKCERGAAQVVCIRGTDSSQEFVDNFFARLVPDSVIPAVSVHQVWGADAGVAQFWLRGKLDFSRPVYVVGHSRGGAVGQILAARLHYFSRDQGAAVRCVTFNSPRAGCPGFAKWFGSRVFHARVVRSGDVVALTPSPLRFRHTVDSVFFNAAGGINFQPGFVTRFSNYVRSFVSHFGKRGLAMLAAHDMVALAEMVAAVESPRESLLVRMLELQEVTE